MEVSDIWSSGDVEGTTSVGGLIGYNYTYNNSSTSVTTTLKKSYASGNVTATGDNAGGLVGYQQLNMYTSVNGQTVYSNIQECYATGNVIGTTNNVGGLVGYLYSYNSYPAGVPQNNYEKVENSFATGEVKGGANVGGLVGYAYRQCAYSYVNQKSNIEITNCYAIGKVTSTGEAGGLIGQLASQYYGSSTITNSYWTPETTMQQASKAGIRRSIQTMLYKTGYSAWDFDNIWTMQEGKTVAYLKNITKTDKVNKENIKYDEYDVIGEGNQTNLNIIRKEKE